jgi:hypothetical protein
LDFGRFEEKFGAGFLFRSLCHHTRRRSMASAHSNTSIVPIYRKQPRKRFFARRRKEPVPAWIRRCRICGCTDLRGCAGGCNWVAANLCSQCLDRNLVPETDKKRHPEKSL